MSFVARIAAALCLTLVSISPTLAQTFELVMFERAGCPYCVRWDREVGAVYPLTPQGRQAPLRKVNLDKGKPAIALETPVRFSPTFVLMKDGREVGRITGYMDNAMFWGVFAKMIERHTTSETQGAPL